jgi:hypothetical protein
MNSGLESVLFWALVVINLLGGLALWLIAYRDARGRVATQPQQMRWVRRIGVVLAVWGVVAVLLANSPLFIPNGPRTVPAGIALFIVPLNILVMSALLLVPEQRAIVRNSPLHLVILVHTLRIPAGAILIALSMQGLLPTKFGIEGGVGDMLSGTLAIGAAYLAAQNVRAYRPLILLWSAIGLADFVNVLTLIPREVTPFFAGSSLPALIGMLPLFGVPLLLVWHVYIVVRLLRLPAAEAHAQIAPA